MKMTKTIAALGILGAALLAFASCKDSSGDGNTTGFVPGVPAKYALQMTVDATGNNIEVGKKAITDSNGDDTAVTEILADTDEGKTTATGHEAERQRCGKRFFKEISAGLNNTEGFRTNIVLNVKDGTWRSTDTGRTAGAGMLFDFNEYKVGNDKTYDFFFLSFKPVFNNEGTAITGVKAYFERYSGVKKTKEGIYTSHTAASALGSNYVQSVVGTWKNKLYTPAENETYEVALTSGSDYYTDTNGNIIIGVDVKQLNTDAKKGIYTIRIGKITYDVGGTTQTFSPSAFKQTWKTSFGSTKEIGKCGENSDHTDTNAYIHNESTAYTNWTHVEKNNKDSNLKGAVLVYGFAPYGTKPVAAYYTCNTKLSSNTPDNTASQCDYVGDWNVANTLDADGVEDKIFYEEGNVVHEYIYY